MAERSGSLADVGVSDIQRVLVTGHSGYIGVVLCKHLVQRGYDMVGLDTDYYEDCWFGSSSPAVPALRKDIRDVTTAEVEGMDAIIHLAALSNDPLGALDPRLTYAINKTATIRLARLARAAGVRRFLFASSCSIYGMPREGWADEASAVEPLTAYAHSKAGSEQGLLALAAKDFAPVLLRCATVYGVSPKMRMDLVVNNLVGWGITRGAVTILSDGTPWRPLIHVEDLARVYEFFLEAPISEISGSTFNVGFNEQNYQVRDIAEAVHRAIPGSHVAYSSKPDLDARSYRVRFDRLRAFTGLQPRWDLESGIEQIVLAYRDHGLTAELFDGPTYARLRHLRSLIEARRLDGELRWTRIGSRA